MARHLRRDRPDPSERAAARMAVGPSEPLPDGIRRFDNRRILVFIALAAIVVFVVQGGLGRGAPSVDGSCTVPGFAFDRTEVTREGSVKWAVRGPSGSQVVIEAGDEVLLGPLPLSDCYADGRFGVLLPDGEHTLNVTLREGEQIRQVGTAKLTVNDPR